MGPLKSNGDIGWVGDGLIPPESDNGFTVEMYDCLSANSNVLQH